MSDNDDIDLIRSDGNQVIDRLDRVHEMLEGASQGKDQATIDTLEAAQKLIEHAQDDVAEMQELALDVEKHLGTEVEGL